MTVLRWVLLLGVGLAAGFLLGRGRRPEPLPTPSSPKPAPSSDEIAVLQARLRESQAETELLKRELADQDLRRQGLEADLKAFREREAPAPAPSPEPSDFLKRLDRVWRMQRERAAPAELRPEAQAVTLALAGSREAQREFLGCFERASVEEAVFLWDVAFGTYLGSEGGNGRMIENLSDFRTGLEGLLAREVDPRKRGLLETLLKRR